MSGFWEYWYGEIPLLEYRIQVRPHPCEHMAFHDRRTSHTAHMPLLAVIVDVAS